AFKIPIDNEVIVLLQEFPDGCIWTVPFSPGTIREKCVRHILNDRITHHQIALSRDKWRIQLQLLPHMFMRVIRVKHDHHGSFVLRKGIDLFCYRLVVRGSLNHRDTFGHGMLLDLAPIVLSNIDVNRQNLTTSTNQLQNGCVKHQGPSMSNPGLYDQSRLHRPDDLLHSNDVLWILNNGSSKPSEVV